MRCFFARLSNFLHRERADREMAREMDSHLALIEDDLIRRGMAPHDARLAARRSYGGVEQTKELHRDERSFVWLEQLLQDARHAYRSLAKSPGFVAVAVLSLAFGIGVNTAIFTLVNGILLKELPVPDPHRIVQVDTQLAFPEFRELRRQDALFSDAVAFNANSGFLETAGDLQKVDYQMITGSYFTFFSARPALGRLLDEEDDRVEGAHPVCVLSHAAWRSYFGGDPRVLGRTIRIDGVPLQVVGVADPGFVGGELQARHDVWIPMALSLAFNGFPRESPDYFWLHTLARLKSGISFAEASSRLKSASPSIGALTRNRRPDADYKLADASKGYDTSGGALRGPLTILMGAVSLVLLVACANLANLLLARANERHREFAIKLSLGISRWRLLRQLLLETLALAFGGGAAAILLSGGLTRFLLGLYNAGNRWQTLSVAPDASVFAFTLGACGLTALVAGLYPAWQASRADASAGLRGASSPGLRRSYSRRVLILVQVSLSVVLLYGASLFTHSLRNLEGIDLGFDMAHVLSVDIEARGSGRYSLKPAAQPSAFAETLERVRQLPAVESAAISSVGVFSGMITGPFKTLDDASPNGRNTLSAEYIYAGPAYFSTLRMPMLRGRDFGPADRAGAPPVAIVNQRLASRAWPGQDPVGKRFRWGSGEGIEVVGVVGDSRHFNVRREALPAVYLALDRTTVKGRACLNVRVRGSLGPVERDIRRIVKATAPDYQVSRASSIELMRDNQISQERLLAFLSNLFGALGTALALVGIYGLISYSVTRRTCEIGVRMSVGAQTGDVLWLFARESLALTAAGMMLGLPLALLLARFAKKMLFEVPTSDPLGVAVTLALIALGALLATYFPGRRATRIDPVQALRCD